MKRELNVPSVPQSQLEQHPEDLETIEKQKIRQRLFNNSGVMKKEDSIYNSSQTQKSQNILQGQKDKYLNLSRENQKIRALKDLSKKSAKIHEEERLSYSPSTNLYQNQ